MHQNGMAQTSDKIETTRESNVANPELELFGTPIRGWEVDLPEVGRRGIELERNVKSFRHFARLADDLASHALVRAAVFQHQARFRRQALIHQD